MKSKFLKTKKMYKKAFPGKKRGFSLVEVLVSLMVISFGILGVSALMFSSIKNSVEAKNQIVASNLAQEGIELVRHLYESGADVLSGNYKIDYRVNAENVATYFTSNPSSFLLYMNNTTGVFGISSGSGQTATKFSRKIVIDNTSNTKVSSWVSWSGEAVPSSFSSLDGSNCTIANKCLIVEAISAQ